MQNKNEAFNALIWQRATRETHSSLPTEQLVTYLAVGQSMMDAKQFYLFWKSLALTLEFIYLKHQRKLTKTGFNIRAERARTCQKDAAGGLDRQKNDIMKLRKLKTDPCSMRLAVSKL